VSSGSGPRDSTVFEIRDALREPGCCVCQLTLRSVARFIQSVAYEQVNDIELRAEIRRARGFCNQHAFEWLREARSVLGTALIYRDVLRASLADLEAGGGFLRRRAPKARGRCPACRLQVEAEARYVEALLALSEADFDGSQGLCRRHALAALRLGGDSVVAWTRQNVEALVATLDEVIRKEDYRFRHEPRTDAERTAPARAIAFAASTEGIVNI
jgi:hypothetical protein